ncbi:type III-A CRISPR-associated protein Cas10/Csm1 [Avibacterium paragallinarum]|uniref:CRISPR system single-strand-specific deoxyribonuclease Cas10/Csm1 (subtype III-A) n=1 Tax=Avibacterium paragallinarum TaxID=728 RepID=A0ABU7QPQ0_AVIPA|nr:type III-A CRISPR-associated protein Cas10/Csm1 [Avibacterium paragallinarum]
MSLENACKVAFACLMQGLKEFAPQHNLSAMDKYIPASFSLNDLQFREEINIANEIALGSHQLKLANSSLLRTLFENIQLTEVKKNQIQKKEIYYYPIHSLTADAIFPTSQQPKSDLEQQKNALWQDFLQALAKIPASHRENLPLWLDHFDTALQCFMTNVPSSYTEELSLYDQLKTSTAIATTLALSKENKEEQPFLLIQGDFFGIQDFIFSGGRETNKRAAKLLRGRSFQVSLFTELAALKVLEACELPSTSQLMNAAGKFLIIAPNSEKVRNAINAVQNELNRWFIENTYGLIGLGLAIKSASSADFFAENFRTLRDSLFKQLERTKLQRLDLTESTQSVQNVAYPFGECKYNSNFPAQDNQQQASAISLDQISIGENLAKKHRVIICDRQSAIYQDTDTNKLTVPLFGYHIIFTSNEEITGKFGQPARTQQIKRLWDFELPKKTSDSLWNGYARRYINAYIPYFTETGVANKDKYKIVEEENLKHYSDAIKTFDYLACEDRVSDKEKEGYIGQAALMTLKGDVDNLGLIFQSGLAQPNFAKMAALSRQMNQFFSLWLPAYCAEHNPNMYTVFAGGDDFFLIGPWHSTQKLAFAMQQYFARYVAHNPDIHFSAGMVMTKVGTPVHRLGEMAEEALEQAKKVDGKNAVTIFQTSLSWQKWAELTDLEGNIETLANTYRISTSYLYSLIYFAKQAQNSEKNLENTMWRSRFYYRTVRYVVDKLDKEVRETALQKITQTLGEQGIEKHKLDFIVPLFNYFYKLRNN